jgi:hypothetical protein
VPTTYDEGPDGTLYATDRGPPRRELTIAWQDGADLSALRRTATPPYLSAAAGTPGLAADQDVWHQLAGLVAASRSTLPVVALAEVPPTTATIVHPDLWLYGTLQGRVQANNVQGNEGRDEVVRVESLTIREQPWER